MVDTNDEIFLNAHLLAPSETSPFDHLANLEPNSLSSHQTRKLIVQRRLKELKCEANALNTTRWMFKL